MNVLCQVIIIYIRYVDVVEYDIDVLFVEDVECVDFVVCGYVLVVE